MAFDPSSDLLSILAEVGDPVTLQNGATVYAHPSVATQEDALEGDGVVAGKTRVLRVSASAAASVVSGQTLTWAGKSWRVVKVQLSAMGHMARLFLGAL